MENMIRIVPKSAAYLQHLKDPKVYNEVIKAVENEDIPRFEKVCSRIGIPIKAIPRIINMVFSAEPDQSWPPAWDW